MTKFSPRFLRDMAQGTKNPAVLDKLAGIDDEDVDYELARNPELPTSALKKILARHQAKHGYGKEELYKSQETCDWLSKHRNADAEMLHGVYLGSARSVGFDDATRKRVVEHPNTSVETLKAMSKDPTVHQDQREYAKRRLADELRATKAMKTESRANDLITKVLNG